MMKLNDRQRQCLRNAASALNVAQQRLFALLDEDEYAVRNPTRKRVEECIANSLRDADAGISYLQSARGYLNYDSPQRKSPAKSK
jgi:hypothetical protein